jgi:hypothetical protein
LFSTESIGEILPAFIWTSQLNDYSNLLTICTNGAMGEVVFTDGKAIVRQTLK